MSTKDKKKYYWLKLKDNFFDCDDIKIIKNQENGSDYIIFWQQLLLKAITSKEIGILRYKDTIPYTPDILATVTDTNIDIVKGALTLFKKLGMIDITENGDIIIDEIIHELIGSETYSAERKRKYREKLHSEEIVPKLSQNCPLELEREKETDIDTDIKKEKEKEKKDTHSNSFSKILKIYQTEYKKNKGIDAIVSSSVIDKLKRLIEDYKNDELVIKIIEKWFRDDYGDPWGAQVGYDITGKKMDAAIEKIITEIQKESKKTSKENKYKITDEERREWEKQGLI
jgi:predicted phage replisome organizer